MSASAEASDLIQRLAQPWQVGDSVKAAIRRAARRAGLDTGLAKRLWYAEARRVDSEVMDKLRAAAAADDLLLERGLHARRTLLARIAACEAALGLHDPNDGCGVDLPEGGRDRALDRAVAPHDL